MSEFKVGDRVYCPWYSEKIVTLIDRGVGDWSLGFKRPSVAINKHGIAYGSSHACVFHATPENHELLSKLYPNVEFEKPKLTGSDLTRQMLADGAKAVLCWVSNISDDDATTRPVVSVVKELTGDGVFKGICFCWKYAVPIPRSHYTMDDSDE